MSWHGAPRRIPLRRQREVSARAQARDDRYGLTERRTETVGLRLADSRYVAGTVTLTGRDKTL